MALTTKCEASNGNEMSLMENIEFPKGENNKK